MTPARGRPEDDPHSKVDGGQQPVPDAPTGFDGELIELLQLLGHDGAALPTSMQLGTW